ncbi:hypothetical protein LP420_11635 [Massilia sp. B-10]|nr:hypothetical protein LP420_11635 [Massilia sp. B-10]
MGSVESVGVVIFLVGSKRYACPGTRFLVHPLHWGFGQLVAADHARVSEWRECLDFDAERYARIFEEATGAAKLQGRYPHQSAWPCAHFRRQPGARRPASSTPRSRRACQPWARPRTGGMADAAHAPKLARKGALT